MGRGPIYLVRMGRVAYRRAWRLMHSLAGARRDGGIEDSLLLVEHPPIVTLGTDGGVEDLRVAPGRLRGLGIEVVQAGRGGRATYHGPGQIVAYPILKLPDDDVAGYVGRLEQVVLELLAEWGIVAGRVERHPGVWIGREKIAAVGIAVEDRVTSHGLALNVDPNMGHFELIVPCGLAEYGVTSMRAVLGRPVSTAEVEQGFVAAFSRVFGRPVVPRRAPGPWLETARATAEERAAVKSLERLMEDLGLHTVCQEGACMHVDECWARGAATFILLGDVCTRGCRFCNVTPGRPAPPDPLEPARVAEAVARLGLHHVVVTSVTRDDLPDGGAGQFAATIRAIRERSPGTAIEVLVPDFDGLPAALEVVADARPDVFDHNVETVERLSAQVRSKADYRQSLAVVAWAKQLGLTTKSGLMVGLGETCGEVIEAMLDLRRAGCDILTIGQYLQPSARQLQVGEYVHPLVFDWYAELGEVLGFRKVVSAPLMRSSYRAEEVWAEARGGE